jgi:SAM-dependent methyltransferase
MLNQRDLAAVQRLRQLFLTDRVPGASLPDYWRDQHDLAAYDAVLAARIGWKWDGALAECIGRGLGRADDALVVDFGCGSGIAAARFAHHCGAGQIVCHDRSPRAMHFAADRLRQSGLRAEVAKHREKLRPDVLLVSHVLGELDIFGRDELLALIARSATVLMVEPGNRSVAGALTMLRDELLPKFRVLAPCPTQDRCPANASASDWCHFFASPPPEVFTDGDWVRTLQALELDARALPYSFLFLQQDGVVPAPRLPRLLGRPEVSSHGARIQACTGNAIESREVARRAQHELWRRLKKDPTSVRDLPVVPPHRK